jgi:RNA polymerase sigma-70 factor, ECF subfamily
MAPTPSRRLTPEALTHLEAIYREYAAFVSRNAARLGVAESARDDVVHDVFMIVAQRLHEFEGRSEIRTWIFGILCNVVRGHRRSAVRRDRRHDAFSHTRPEDVSVAHDGTVADRLLLTELLDELDDDRRAVFVSAELEELTAPEIAEALAINVNTVYSRLRRAKDDLKQALARRLASPERSAGSNQ